MWWMCVCLSVSKKEIPGGGKVVVQLGRERSDRRGGDSSPSLRIDSVDAWQPASAQLRPKRAVSASGLDWTGLDDTGLALARLRVHLHNRVRRIFPPCNNKTSPTNSSANSGSPSPLPSSLSVLFVTLSPSHNQLLRVCNLSNNSSLHVSSILVPPQCPDGPTTNATSNHEKGLCLARLHGPKATRLSRATVTTPQRILWRCLHVPENYPCLLHIAGIMVKHGDLPWTCAQCTCTSCT